MKHEATTLRTKKALADSLKKIMIKKPLSQITVTEIISDCGVNRKTFYYHFQNICDLLKWMLEEEAVAVVKKYDLMVDYQEVLLFVMDYVDENKHIINCAYDFMGREGMKRFLYADFIDLVQTVIKGAERQLNLHVPQGFREFLCRFYTEALAGVLIDWFKEPKAFTREEVADYVFSIFQNSLPGILASHAQPADPF